MFSYKIKVSFNKMGSSKKHLKKCENITNKLIVTMTGPLQLLGLYEVFEKSIL